MLTWIVAAAAGVAAAALLYGLSGRGRTVSLLPLAVLRAGALTLLFALLFDAVIGRPQALPPLVALDVSLSWQRAADDVAWREAVARAGGLSGETPLLFGDSTRSSLPPAQPRDGESSIQGVVERAIGAGRPLVIVTDGELDDPTALDDAPAGSRIEMVTPARGPDVAVVGLTAPRFAVAGDTIDVRVGIRSGELAVAGATLSLLVDDVIVGTATLDTLPARTERTEALRARLPAREGPARLRAAVSAPADAEPRNDTAGVSLDLSRAAGAVLVSTAPDFDARFMVPVLRGAVAIPTEAFYRVAPGNWRREGLLAAVSEGDVRGALARAPLAILHGDTAYFGAPRTATGGSIALVPAPVAGDGEWFATAAPPSPLGAALSGVHWDSLPPLVVSGGAGGLGWEGLIAARGRQFDRRPVITGTDAGRRVVVVGASGFWRWHFRGGVAADAHAALWGGIFDWLAAERPDPRAAIPAAGIVRAGEPVRWRRGAGQDTVVVARLVPHGQPARADSVVIRFPRGVLSAETPPLEAGVWDVRVPGGSATLEVNASRELLPRPVSVAAGSVPGVPTMGERPRLREAGWAYLLLVGALCAEWLLRRRRGLR